MASPGGLLALPIPLVRELAAPVRWTREARMALPGATPADGVVDIRNDALVRHGPVSQIRRRAPGYRVWGSNSDLQSAPVAQSSMLQVNGTGHGCRNRLPPEIRVHIT